MRFVARFNVAANGGRRALKIQKIFWKIPLAQSCSYRARSVYAVAGDLRLVMILAARPAGRY